MPAYDPEATRRFFDSVYSELDKSAPQLHARDRLLLRHVIAQRINTKPKIIDFGCGEGRLLRYLIENGHDAIGVEKNDGMRRYAVSNLSRLGAADRVIAGGVQEFCALPSASFDVVVIMGVLQYLPDEEYGDVLRSARRILRPGGVVAATFQNAFFDLFTFNKYTVEFFETTLIGPMLNPDDRAEHETAVRELIVRHDKPEHAQSRARDNVFVRLTNPLLFDAEMRKIGLSAGTKYFYDFFGLPPLAAAKHKALSDKIAEWFEVEHATSWQGHFMANAFLVELRLA